VQGGLYMVFIAIALLVVDWVSGVILLLSLVPLAILTRWFQVNSQRMFRRTRVASARMIVHFVESMTGIRAVQAFRKERRNERDFGALVEDNRDANARVIQLFGTYEPILILIGNVTLGAVLLVGGFRVADGSLPIGILLAALLYTRNFFAPAEEMAMFYNSYQSAAAALEKISGVLDELPSVPDPVKPVDCARRRAPSRSMTSPSRTRRSASSCRRSRSRSRRGRRSPSSARRGRASRRSRSSSHASTTHRRGVSRSTVSTCARCIRRTCGARS
jgi:ABC-type multidrug transport system fused ATPase/permease subunit